MTQEGSVESLFKEHSFDEIESVRDNIKGEIEKKTDLLKSIVKGKYRDIVETSEAIQSMKLNLIKIEQSLWQLDRNIAEFYTRVKEPNVELNHNRELEEANTPELEIDAGSGQEKDDNIIRKLLITSSELWGCYDSGNLTESVRLLNESVRLLEKAKASCSSAEQKIVVDKVGTTIARTRDIIKNSLWHRIQAALPDQIGIIASSDQEDLYQLSISSSMSFISDSLQKELSDTSFHAQIRRYQPCSYFNSSTGQVIVDPDTVKGTTHSVLQIPKNISPELDAYLFKVCKVINTVAGFNLNRSSIVESLRVTIENALRVYSSIIASVDCLKAEAKRKRALQLYFDVLYIRILLNTSKNIDLIEKLDPEVNALASRYELMLDTIELYMISAAIHNNVMNLSQSTIRLHGLLIPHLQ